MATYYVSMIATDAAGNDRQLNFTQAQWDSFTAGVANGQTIFRCYVKWDDEVDPVNRWVNFAQFLYMK